VGLGAGLPDEYVIGSVLLLSRAAVDDVGGFDEDFFLYAEETDWEKRALDRGWRIGYAPELVASHLGAGTSSDPRRRELLFHAAHERYYRKHHGTLGWQVARAARLTGDAVRAVVAGGEHRTEARRRLTTYRTGPQRALRRLDGSAS
jgi:GT2 family glycosyltransferase